MGVVPRVGAERYIIYVCFWKSQTQVYPLILRSAERASRRMRATVGASSSGDGACAPPHREGSEFVNRAGVGVENLPPLGFRQRRLEGEAGVVVVPVRIVGGEQQAIDADPFDQLAQMFGFVGLVDRLRREPEMLAHIFAWATLEVRHLAAEALEMLVHPPDRRGDPAEAALDEDEFQFREALGHAL